MRKTTLLIAASFIFTTPTLAKDGVAASEITISLAKRPSRPENRIPFPEIHDWKSLKITLSRSVCFGTCPDYTVEIDGDGQVSYEGREFVAVPGKHWGKIAAQSVRDLYAKFKKADFYWLFGAYRADITDNPENSISISFDGHTKHVVDYVGLRVNMPPEIRDLEKQIDSAAGVEKWVASNSETFAILKAEGWNFRSGNSGNRRLLVAASQQNNSHLIEQYLAAGMPAGGQYGCQAVERAARNRNAAIVRRLISAGAPVFWGHPEDKGDMPCSALMDAAESGDADSVKSILEQHPDVNWRPTLDNEKGSSAIERAAENAHGTRPGRDYIAVLKLLVAAGSDVRPKGQPTERPILADTADPAAMKLLINAGADVNARSKSFNETPLMWQYDPKSAQLLLENGADPYAVDSDGKNALQKLEQTGFKEAAAVVRRWMTDHPEKPH